MSLPSRQQSGDEVVRASVRIEGNVQGVGFRPFLYRLAKQYELGGHARNSLQGVELEVEGTQRSILAFLKALEQSPPPLAAIADVSHRFVEPRGDEEFLIRESSTQGVSGAPIPPDVAVCDDCLQEMFDCHDRRHRYPFISCSNCGPRFTIMAGLPYDRQNTSMRAFPMCETCQAEYDNPASRRFQCQTNACWTCGPRVWLQAETDSPSVTESSPRDQRDAVATAVRLLKQGAIVAIKGIGGFHLACDATNRGAVDRLRHRKHRETKPFAMMVPDLGAARTLCHIDETATALLTSRARPIVLSRRRTPGRVAESVAHDSPLLGLMLPYAPLHHALFFDESQQPRLLALVMTSGNAADVPIARTNQEALQGLSDLADAFLLHDRDILARVDDSLIRCDPPERPKPSVTSTSTIIRRARGYAPLPIQVKHDTGEILAVGGHLKNAIAASRGSNVFLSQHIGDLHNLETLETLGQTADRLRHLLGVRPGIIAHDMHPDYLSTRYAQQMDGVQLVPVQHHHAHVAACMAEHELDGPVIGVVLDGTGYGTDGHVWGGEILIANYDGFHRAAHLREVPLPGNEQAIKQPWRMAVSYLDATYGDAWWDLPISFVRSLDRSTAELLIQSSRRALNAPKTSSCGRLFDAVSALLGLRQINTFEGQAAMELEMAADAYLSTVGLHGECESWEAAERNKRELPGVSTRTAPRVIDQLPLIRNTVTDIQNQLPLQAVANRFHSSLAQLIAKATWEIARQTNVRQVVMSGGCLQNHRLRLELEHVMTKRGLTVWSPSQVPPNDGGLALGQIMVASWTTRAQSNTALPSSSAGIPK